MHTLFVGQVAHGELEIEVEVLRRVWGGDTLVAYATQTSLFTFLNEARRSALGERSAAVAVVVQHCPTLPIHPFRFELGVQRDDE